MVGAAAKREPIKKKAKLRSGRSSEAVAFELELELELIQTHMAQKPLLWVEVGV